MMILWSDLKPFTYKQVLDTWHFVRQHFQQVSRRYGQSINSNGTAHFTPKLREA